MFVVESSVFSVEGLGFSVQGGSWFCMQRAAPPRKALRGGIQKSILTDLSGNVGDSRQMLTKNGAMAPRTGLGYPHEGPFVGIVTLHDVPRPEAGPTHRT